MAEATDATITVAKLHMVDGAGAGVKAGYTYGETDEFSYRVAKDGVHIHDFNAALLHILGIDHERLTFKYQGRDFRLTDVHRHVVKPLLA